jgi:hypothetical protein
VYFEEAGCQSHENSLQVRELLGKYSLVVLGNSYRDLRPSQCWDEVSMDFIIGLWKSEGKSVIMVIVDKLTKYAHFCALSHAFKASIVSTAFMETI